MKKRSKVLAQFFVVALLTLLVCEGIVRLFGFTGYRIQPYTLKSSPSLNILPHGKLGFSLNPGIFEVTINEKVSYSVTHGPDSIRTIPAYLTSADSPRKTVDFHGCSFTYGMGVDDSETFPSIIASERPDLFIRNLGVPGYGTIQTFLRIREQELNNDLPDIVILNYASFHPDRNGLTPKYRQSLKIGFERANAAVKNLFKESKIPYGDIISDTLVIKWESWEGLYSHWPLRSKSALVNYLQYLTERASRSDREKDLVTDLVISEIANICRQHSIAFIVTGLTEDEKTKKQLTIWNEKGIQTLDISLDLNSEEYTHLPFDSHPNSKAHLHYAEKLMSLELFQ